MSVGFQSRSQSILATARTSTVLPVLVALVVYLALGFNEGRAFGRHHQGDPSVFIKAGTEFAAPSLLPRGALLLPGSGYDGQFFFYLAQDPLLHGKAATRSELSSPHIDNVPYRYQRILLPVLGWLTSWGNPDVLQWTLPLINLVAVLGAGFLLARFLALRGRTPWLATVFMLSVGVAIGVVDDLSDPLAVGLFLAGVVWWLEGRTALAVVALTGCLLARELYLVPVGLLCVSELVRRGRHAWRWAVPVLVWIAWQVYLRLTLAASPTHGSNPPSPVPLLGAARKLRLVLREDPWGIANWEVLFIALLLLIWLVFFSQSLAAARQLRISRRLTRENLLPIIGLAAMVFVPFLTVALWHYMPSYSRYGAPAAAMMVIAYAVRPGRALLALSLAMLTLSLTNPIIGLVPTNRGPGTESPAVGIGF